MLSNTSEMQPSKVVADAAFADFVMQLLHNGALAHDVAEHLGAIPPGKNLVTTGTGGHRNGNHRRRNLSETMRAGLNAVKSRWAGEGC